jgi:DNA modification methylase
MTLSKVRLDEIRINPEKRRKVGDVTELADSISRLGLLNPITITKDKRLVAGFHRFTAAKKLGWDEIECVVKDLSDLEARLAEIDENLVRNELSILERAEQYKERKEIYEKLYPETLPATIRGGPGRGHKSKNEDVRRPSFVQDAARKTNRSVTTIKEDLQIAKNIDDEVKERLWGTKFEDSKRELLFLSRLDPMEQRKAVDKALKGETKDLKSAINQIQRQKRITPQTAVKHDNNFYCGDARDGLKQLSDRSVSLLLTDPPYGVSYRPHKRGYESTAIKRIAYDESLESASTILDEVLDVISPKMSENCHCYFFTGWKSLHSMLEVVKKYFEIRNVLVWDKMVHGRGDLDFWAPQYELIIFSTRGNRPLIGPRPVDMLRFQKVNGIDMIHPTQKPVELLKFLIEKSSLSGELVVDPFAGSGSTLVAAKAKNRRYFGCELDPEWHQEGLKRLSN